MGSGKSKNVNDKIKFVERLEKGGPLVQSLFESLKQRSLEVCNSNDWGYTNKADFRIAFQETICELVPMLQPPSVRVILRVDRQYPTSLIDKLSMIDVVDVNGDRPGHRWIKFSVTSEDQVDEAIELIQNVYSARAKLGNW